MTVKALDEEPGHLADVQGWLDNEDPFFSDIDAIVDGRAEHIPRVLKAPLELEGLRWLK